MESKIIEYETIIPYHFLDKNYKTHILKNLRKSLKNTCSEKHGYILDIVDIVKIVSSTIQRFDLKLSVKLFLLVKMLKPVLDTIISAKVEMLFSYGILLNCEEKMKIFIPSKRLENYSFNDKYFIYGKDKKYNIGSSVSIKVKDIKFNENNYKCIGELVEN